MEVKKRAPACSICIHHCEEKVLINTYVAIKHLCGAQAYFPVEDVYNNKICQEVFYIQSDIVHLDKPEDPIFLDPEWYEKFLKKRKTKEENQNETQKSP